MPDDTSTTDQTADDQQQDDDQNDEPQLGVKGEAALVAERAARRKAEKDAKTTKAELERLRTASQSEQEKAIAAAKAQGATEALSKANARVLAAEVRAAAAGKLADPADASRFLDLSEFEVGDDGEVDAKAIAKAIDQLVKEKPYLGTNGAKRSTGSGDGGARGNGKTPPDMNAWLRGERVSL